jgi:hypothetical protein
MGENQTDLAKSSAKEFYHLLILAPRTGLGVIPGAFYAVLVQQPKLVMAFASPALWNHRRAGQSLGQHRDYSGTANPTGS